MPHEVVMRHRPPHFQHIFSGDHYAAGYYSYLWSEVLDADAFNAFEEAGDVFDPAVAKRLRDNIYAAGGAREPPRPTGIPRPDAIRGPVAEEARAHGRSMNLYSAGHRRGVVAAPHHAAAEAGRAILAEGGNAIEAMVAMAATIAAVYPHMNHIGGDGFWLVREPSGPRTRADGGGSGGCEGDARASIASTATTRFRRAGRSPRSRCRRAVGHWMLALQAGEAYGGKLPLDVLLGPAISHAREGYKVTRSQARLTAEKLAECKDAPGFAKTFLIDGKPPAEGATLKQAALAATLDQLANAGLGDFYRGDVGREIAADLERIGSPVTRGDLERYEAKRRRAALGRAAVRHALQHAPAHAGTGLADHPGVVRAAARDRGRELRSSAWAGRGDQARVPGARPRTSPTRRGSQNRRRAISTSAFLDSEAARIDRRKAAKWPAPPGEGDTIWMGAADASGLVVSYIQSIYWEFGSACVLPRTGVLMQNRGASFSLENGALNPLRPGRKPFHTLNPALAVLKDGRVMAYGTMGGDGQPQSQAALFTRHVLYRQPLERGGGPAALAARAHVGVEPHQPAARIALFEKS